MAGSEVLVTGWILKRRRNYFGSIRSHIKGIFRKRGKLVCEVCGAKENLELHHIIPLSMGGSNDIDNLVCLCHDHHVEVHHDGLDLDVEGKEMEY